MRNIIIILLRYDDDNYDDDDDVDDDDNVDDNDYVNDDDNDVDYGHSLMI